MGRLTKKIPTYFDTFHINKNSLNFITTLLSFSPQMKEITLKLNTISPKNYSHFTDYFLKLFNVVSMNTNLKMFKIQINQSEIYTIEKQEV